MSYPNPYQPPAAGYDALPSPAASATEVPYTIVDAMRQTKPWATLLGVLGFVGVGLCALLGIGTLAVGRAGAFPAYIGLFYFAAGGLYIFPSLFLWRYGSAIKLFLDHTNLENLGEALVHQKSFWRFTGIAAIVMMVLYGLVLVGAFVFGLTSALNR